VSWINPKSVLHKDIVYEKSDSWKCRKNPSGAHYWLIGDKEARCKYCSEIRKIGDRGLIEVNRIKDKKVT